MKCLFCINEVSERKDGKTDDLHITCPNCGKYSVTDFFVSSAESVINDKDTKTPKHMMSGYIRECNEKKLSLPIITTENYDEIVDLNRIPKTTHEKIQYFLKYLSGRTKYFGENIHLGRAEIATAYAMNEYEMGAIVNAMQENGLIEIKSHSNSGSQCSLTYRGSEAANEAMEKNTQYKKAFIAMWFNPEMQETYKTCLFPAVKECGYEPLIISEKEHLNDITSEIIAEIKQSRFLIADLTGSRGGVYFEAGFAYGLGIPVIWTCKKDWFTKENIHFDVEHFPFILWESKDELKTKIANRIKATIEK